MRSRLVPLALILMAVVCVGVAAYAGFRAEVVGDTVCGPIIVQRNRRFPVCDGFFRRQTTTVAVLLLAGLIAYVASVIADRAETRRRVTPDRRR